MSLEVLKGLRVVVGGVLDAESERLLGWESVELQTRPLPNLGGHSILVWLARSVHPIPLRVYQSTHKACKDGIAILHNTSQPYLTSASSLQSIMSYNGGSIVAMVGKDCVAIASDLRLGNQALTIATNFEKVILHRHRIKSTI